MKTKIAKDVIAEHDMVNDEIRIVRVYRESTGYTFNDSRMDDLAKFTIQAISEGWMKIK